VIQEFGDSATTTALQSTLRFKTTTIKTQYEHTDLSSAISGPIPVSAPDSALICILAVGMEADEALLDHDAGISSGSLSQDNQPDSSAEVDQPSATQPTINIQSQIISEAGSLPVDDQGEFLSRTLV
jgi:hypothetical protein